MLKKALIFLVGVAVGAVGTYLITRKQRDIIRGEELEDFRRELRTHSEETSEEEGTDTSDDQESSEEPSDGLYNGLDPGSPPDDDPYEKPRPISREDWLNAPGEYDRATLLYYRMNGILTDEFDQIVASANLENVVGEGTLDMFGRADPEDPDASYALDEVHKTVYEVLLQHKSFEMALYGSVEDGM